MSTLQEKLKQRATRFRVNKGIIGERSLVEFARAELQRAAEIADKAIGATRHEIADEIRKLME